jgi:hypothetical protein
MNTTHLSGKKPSYSFLPQLVFQENRHWQLHRLATPDDRVDTTGLHAPVFARPLITSVSGSRLANKATSSELGGTRCFKLSVLRT